MVNLNRFSKPELFVLLTFVYFVAGKLGLKLAYVHSSATAVWAPTGIAIAAFLILGYRFWPAIFLGAFFVNLSTTHLVGSSLAIAVGNTVEGLLAAYLINRFASGRFAFNSATDIFKYTLAGIVSTGVCATIGATTLLFTGQSQLAHYGSIWLTWWLGDISGALIVAPVLLILFNKNYVKLNRAELTEATVWVLLLIGTCLFVFGNFLPPFVNRPLSFLVIPFLIWPALRFSQREVAIAIVIMATIAITGTILGGGPFSIPQSPNSSLLLLQSFILVIALTKLSLAAIVLENKQAQKKLSAAYEDALSGWSKALDMRDKETEGHTVRVTEMTVKLAQLVGVEENELTNIRRGCLLHDIWKLGIPDNILFKPGPLSEDELKIVRKHPVNAHELLRNTPYFQEAIEIPYSHHEKWDGSGYPRGLKGLEIPLSARIFAVVDVWDALRSERPYRAAMEDEDVFKYMQSMSGEHFDPQILNMFFRLVENLQDKEQDMNTEPINNAAEVQA